MSTKPPTVHLIGEYGEYEVVVFRCTDEAEALRLAGEKLWQEYSEDPWFDAPNPGDELILKARPGWYRINLCHCLDQPHKWDIGYADGPGPGNSRGFIVEYIGTRSAAEAMNAAADATIAEALRRATHLPTTPMSQPVPGPAAFAPAGDCEPAFGRASIQDVATGGLL